MQMVSSAISHFNYTTQFLCHFTVKEQKTHFLMS